MLFHYAIGETKLRPLAQVHGEQTDSLIPQMPPFIFPLSDE